MTDLKPRNFQLDFCIPAFTGLTKTQANRVGLALDCAVAFGVLEYLDGNGSLQDRAQLEAAYWDKVLRLKGL